MNSKLNCLAILFIAAIFSSCSTLAPFDPAQADFEQGLAFFNQGRFEEAVPYFRRATEEDPNFGRAYLYLGRSYVSLSRWRDAISPLRTAYRLAPGAMKREAMELLIDALFAAAINDFKLGDFGTSVERFKEILELSPGSTRARNELVPALVSHGGKLLADGSVREAIAAYSEALQLSPDRFDAHLGLARAFLRNGDFVKALQSAGEALKIKPSDRDAQSLLNNLKNR